MVRYLAVAFLLSGAALGIRGFYVWTGCGYDCPALAISSLTATGAILFGGLAAVAGAIALGVSILSRNSG
jgi:hypothetical protein